MNVLKRVVLSLGLFVFCMMSVKIGVRAEDYTINDISITTNNPPQSFSTVNNLVDFIVNNANGT